LRKRKRIRMKLKFVFAGIALCLFGLMACEKETSFETGGTPTGDTTDNNNGGGNNVTGDMRAKIDGAQWVADKTAAAARMNGRIAIAGLSIDGKTVAITLADSGVHQYTLYFDGLNAGAYQDSSLADITAFTSNAGSSAAETGGTLNITSIDEANKKISGTFSFKAKRETDETFRNITEGSFTNLTYSTTLPPGNSSDTLRVKIDGVDFTPTLIIGIDIFGNLSVSGSAASGYPTVGITVPSGTLPGTYELEGMFGTYIGQYNISNSQLLAASSGTLEILEHNTTTKRIRANFSFTAAPLLGTGSSAELTQGYFAVTYQ
jgi:Family of unknown function (DUF6252)